MRSKEAVLASDEKSKCGSHPEHLDEKETVFAYMAGVFDVDGEIKNGNASVTSDCKFRSAIFEAFFGGSVKKGKSKFTWSGGDVKELAERIAFHVQAESKEELARAYLFHTKGIRKPSVLIRRRKFQGLLGGADRSSAAGSVEHHAPQGVGEDREPNGIASETERPHPSKLNPAGFDSRGERVAILERVAPEIKLSGVTKRSLRQSSKTCFVCKYVLNPKSKVLEPSDGMTVLSKVKHMEKCIRRIIPVDCSVCEKAIMAHEYEADDLSACPSCCKETPEDLSYKD